MILCAAPLKASFLASRNNSRAAKRRSGPCVVAFQGNDAIETVTSTKNVTLSVPLEIAYGETIKLVGGDSKLGGWEIESAVDMQWSDGHNWTVSLDLPAGFESEFKLVHVIPGQPPVWEFIPNRLLTVPINASAASIALQWCSETSAEEVEAVKPAKAVDGVPSDGLYASDMVTPQFQAALTEPEVLIAEEAVLSQLEAAFAAEEAAKEDITVEEVLTMPEMSAEVQEGIEAALTLVGDEATAVTAPEKSSAIKNAAKTAGAVALGVAGAALLSALAVDVADTAILGAFVAAAGGMAMGTTGSTKKTKAVDGEGETEEGAELQEGAEEVVEGRAVSQEPGVIMAAGLLSAFDAGKSMVKSLENKSNK